MRFKLYLKNGNSESLFYDTENSDQEYAISEPTLKLELSKAGSLDFTIYPTHPMYDDFHRMTTYIRVEQDDEEIFRGRVLSVEDTTYMERKVQCEGDLAYLVDSYQVPDQKEGAGTGESTNLTSSNAAAKAAVGSKASSVGWHNINMTIDRTNISEIENTTSTLAAQFTKYINQHNSQMVGDTQKQFTVGQVTVPDDGEEAQFSSAQYRDTKNAIDSDLLSVYGGFLQTRKSGNTVYIDWLKEPISNLSQPIKMGVNLIDLQQTKDSEDLYTVFVPVGDGQLTLLDPDLSDYSSLQVVNHIGIGITNAINSFGYIYKTESFSGVKDRNELLNQALMHLVKNYPTDSVSFTVKAIDLNVLDDTIDAIKVGSYVLVESDPHDISEVLCCTAIEYDLQNPENNSYEIGVPKENLSKKSQSERATSAENTARAAYSGYCGEGNSSKFQDVINQHARQIKATADELFEIATRILRVQAYSVDVHADETVTLTCKDLNVNANGSIKMAAGTAIQIGSLYIGEAAGDLFFSGEGEFYDEVTFDSGIVVDGQSGISFGNDATIVNGTNVEAQNIYYLGSAGDLHVDLGTSVVLIEENEEPPEGQIGITITQANGETYDVNFNIADTQAYIDGVAAAKAGMGLRKVAPTSTSPYRNVVEVVDDATAPKQYLVESGVLTSGTLDIGSQTFNLGYESSSHKYLLASKATIGGGDPVHYYTFRTGTEAYDDGYDDGEVDGVSKVKVIMDYPTGQSSGYKNYCRPSTVASAVSSIMMNTTVSLSGTETDANNNTINLGYNSTDHKYYIAGYALADNVKCAKLLTSTGTEAYDDGYDDGEVAGEAIGYNNGFDAVSGSDITYANSTSYKNNPTKTNSGIDGYLWIKRSDGTWEKSRQLTVSHSHRPDYAYHKESVYNGAISIKMSWGYGYLTVTSNKINDTAWGNLR